VPEPPIAKVETAPVSVEAHTMAIGSYEGGQISGNGEYGHHMDDQYNGQDEEDMDDGYGPIGIKEDG
jgi:hypothetical protein